MSQDQTEAEIEAVGREVGVTAEPGPTAALAADTMEPPDDPVVGEGDSISSESSATGPPQNAEGDDAVDEQGIYFEHVKDVIESCTAVPRNAAEWEFLGADGRRVEIDMETPEFLADLEEELGEAFLLECGIFEKCGDTVRRASWVEDDAPLYVAFDDEKRTVRFSCQENSLFPIMGTVLDYAVAKNSAESAGTTTNLFVCDSAEAAQIVRRVGLPAVNCDGLESITHRDVNRLFGDGHGGNGWRYFLVLLDFDLCHLLPQPAAFGDVLARLADAADLYCLDLGERFGVCRPTSFELLQLKRATKFADASAISQLLQGWGASTMNSPISNWRSLLPTEEACFSKARAELVAALRNSSPLSLKRRVQVALPDYEAALYAKVTQKFEAAMDGSADEFELLENKQARDIVSILVKSDPLVREAQAVLADAPAATIEDEMEAAEQQIRWMSVLKRFQQDRLPKRRAASLPRVAQSRTTNRSANR